MQENGMRWIELRAAYEEKEGVLTGEVVAHVFLDAGLSGVALYEEPDPRDDDRTQGAPLMKGPPRVVGYFPEDARWPERLLRIKRDMAALQRRAGIRVSLSHRLCEESEWAEAWKRHFHLFRIGKRLVVKPTWERYLPGPGDLILEIDPGMAFGTGSHATTALCLALLEKYVRGGQAFLDVGTGSGILMIAAARLGAARLVGVDKDPSAVAVAKGNLRQNRIDPGRFLLLAADLVEAVSGTFHLVAANILTGVIVKLVPRIPALLAPGGVFICSGMFEKNTHRVEQALKTCGMTILEMPENDGWAAIAATR